MMPATYVDGATPVHRCPAGAKVSLVFVAGTMMFLFARLELVSLALLGIVALYLIARIPFRLALRQLRPIVLIVVLVFAVQWVLAGVTTGALVSLRLLSLVLLASLVTLTTRTSEMMAAMERALRPLRCVGVSGEKVSLAMSLTLRFIPVLSQVVNEVREAQRARGLDRSMVALALPVVVRTLSTADQVSEAIEARSNGRF